MGKNKAGCAKGQKIKGFKNDVKNTQAWLVQSTRVFARPCLFLTPALLSAKGLMQRFHKMKSTIRKDKGKKKEKLDPMINVRCVRLETLRSVAPEATSCSAF
jgi:hypothetical protein